MKQIDIKHTSQGFSYVDVNIFQVVKWGGYGICDCCGKGPFAKLKLIYVLHDTYCDKCFSEWQERSKRLSKEDIEYDLSLQKENDKKWYKSLLERSNVNEKNDLF